MRTTTILLGTLLLVGCPSRNTTTDQPTTPDAAQPQADAAAATDDAPSEDDAATPPSRSATDGGARSADDGGAASDGDGGAALQIARPDRVDLPAEAATALAKASNSFAFDLYDRLRTTPGNVVFSPASIVVALSMTWAGARGATAAQMSKVLHLPAQADTVHGSAANLLHDWNDPDRDSYELRVVNRLFAEKSYPFEDAFVAVTRDRYAASLEMVDFINAPDPAREHINQWVEAQTNDRIEDLLPPGSIDNLTRLVLTNAVYFLGQWASEFDADDTNDGAFHVDDTRDVEVPFMTQTQRFRYAQVGGAHLLQMGYVGEDLAMLVALPAKRGGLEALETGLDAARMDGWVGALRPVKVEVHLPRFRVAPAESMRMKQILSDMGMPLPFSRAADFTGMAQRENPAQELRIGNVFHKAFVEVTEEGTEAAAATAVQMTLRGAAMPAPVPVFRADHPFLFFIRDVRSGTILFVGRVTDPS